MTKKTQSAKKKWCRAVLYLGLVSFLVTFAVVFFGFGQKKPPQLSKGAPTPTLTPTPIPQKTFLLLGYGGGRHDGGKLTDTIIEAYVEPERKRVTLISIPRDLWVTIASTNSQTKINYAYVTGGLDGAKKTVASVTGIKPDYAAAIDFYGFVKLLKKLEPIKVDVPYTFTDNFYPIEGKEDDTCGFSQAKIQELNQKYSDYKLETQFPCRYESTHFEKGQTEMTAEEALKFVRSRHGDDGKGDFGRSQRQQALIIAVKNKLLSPSMWIKFPGLVKDTFQLVDTDLTPEELLNYVKLLKNIDNLNDWQFKTIVLDTTNVLANGRAANGAYILKPTANPQAITKLKDYVGATASAQVKAANGNDPFATIKKFIQLNLISFEITPTPTPLPTNTPTPTSGKVDN